MSDKSKGQLLERLNVLRNLRKQGYNYIARSEFGRLWAYRERPIKEINFWHSNGEVLKPLDMQSFQDVEWSDNEPLSILGEIVRIEKMLKG